MKNPIDDERRRERPMADVPTTVTRPRLEAHADSIFSRRATIVVAGGGFGKTTILRAWARILERKAAVAWVALSERQADPRAFATAVDTVLKRVGASIGEALDFAPDASAPSPETLARALIDEIVGATEERDRDVVIFLDDFNTVATSVAICDLVGVLLRSLPPRAHIVIASRFPLAFSPLVRLRAEGLVADFTQDDLRFTKDEALAMFADAELTAGDQPEIAGVLARTEGWAMALRLSMQGRRSGVRFAWSPDSQRSLFNYLADEVLRQQTPEVRMLLLDCAVVSPLDPKALAHVLERDDGNAIVERLRGLDCYIESSGDGAIRFHALFREFLLATFAARTPERLRALHHRYATHLQNRGDMMGAVIAFLEAGDYRAAADRVVQVQFAIRYGEDVERIAEIFARIPLDLKRERPRLLQLEAKARSRLGDTAGAEQTYARAREFALKRDFFGTATACAIEEAMLADELRQGGHGSFERSLELCTLALAYAKRTGDQRETYVKMASLALGRVHAARFEYALARPYLEDAERLQRGSTTEHANILTTIAEIEGWQGRWQRALETAELAEDILHGSGETRLAGRAMSLQAKAIFHLHHSDDVGAIKLAERAVELLRTHKQFDDLPDACLTLARLNAAQIVPAVAAARAALDEAERYLERAPNKRVAFDIRTTRSEIAMVVGDPAGMRRELAAAEVLAERSGDASAIAYVGFFRGIRDTIAGDHASAAERFERARVDFEAISDVFHAQLADIGAYGALARIGPLDEARVRALLDRLESAEVRHGVFCAPRAAQFVIAWAIRSGSHVARSCALLAENARNGGDDIIVALANDASAPVAARARAIAHIGNERREERRSVLATLARHQSTAIAAAATTALALYPREPAPQIALELVGGLQVHIGDETFDERDARWSRRKAVEMLRLLALAARPVAKAELIASLWPEGAGSTETSLRVTLHALRRALEPNAEGGGYYIAYDGTTVALRRDAVLSIDAHDAVAAFQRATLAHARGEHEEAERLYALAVDVLAPAQNMENVAAWLEPHVRSWRETLVAALRGMAELALTRGAHAEARAAIERALTIDSLDEESISVALDIAVATNDPEHARTIFVEYKHRLRSDLATSPGAEILAKFGDVLRTQATDRTSTLTAREIEILGLIGRGQSNKQIAQILGLSPWTIANHVARILRKLRVESRAAAVAAAGGLLA